MPGKFDRPPMATERRAAAVTGKELHASIVEPAPDAETAELEPSDKPLLGSERASEVVTSEDEQPPAKAVPAVPAPDKATDDSPSAYYTAKRDGGDEADREAKAEMVSAAEEVDKARLQASYDAAAKLSSTDFETGGPELTYLSGGVPVEHAEAVAKHKEHKARKAAAKAARKLQGKK